MADVRNYSMVCTEGCSISGHPCLAMQQWSLVCAKKRGEQGAHDGLVTIARYQMNPHGVVSHVEALCWTLSPQQELYLSTWESACVITTPASLLYSLQHKHQYQHPYESLESGRA